MNEPNSEETIFAEAQRLPPDERTAYLDQSTNGNTGLRQRVESLLGSYEAGDFLEQAAATQLRPTLHITVPLTEKPGDTIGRYKLLQQIGEGGCGVVYMAEQAEPVRRRVALKIIKLGMDTKSVIARFEAERQAVAMMDHPNIAKVFDAGATETGRPYFVMELVRGMKITDYCDEAKLSTRARLDLFIQVCQAIQHAHQKGIIHRDIKPSNILVTVNDGVPVPKVIDFGIAKATTGQQLTDKTVFTAFEQFIGTPAYMSPEQAVMTSLDIDTRSDIYALGVLLYELLTGKTPFDAKELLAIGLDELRRTICEQEPPRPSTRLSTLAQNELSTTAQRRGIDAPKLVSQLRGDLDWVVMKALEKDRARRYETASGLSADIQRHLNNEPVVARPPSAAYRFQKMVHRNKLLFTAASAVALALVAGLSFSTWSFLRERKAHAGEAAQRRTANEQRQRAEANARIAGEQEKLAEQQKIVAETNEKQATENALHSRRLLYAADMNLAQQALKANNLGRARRLLDHHRPSNSPGNHAQTSRNTNVGQSFFTSAALDDLRGWEWRYLWQQCQSDALTMLNQHTMGAFSVSFSPDGRRLAVGYFDGRIELWDVQVKRLLKVLHQGVSAYGHVAFSPRSDVLVATAGQGVVKLHDLAAGTESVLCEVQDWVRDLTFSKDGQWLTVLALAGNKSPVLVLDVAQGRIVSSNSVACVSRPHCNNVRLSPDQQRLYVSQGVDNQPKLQCVRMPDWEVLWEIEGEQDVGFTAMALSPDGRFLVTSIGYQGSTIRVWNALTGQLAGKLEGHTDSIFALAFSSDGSVLASASSDQTIRLWDTATWKESAILRGHGDQVYAVAFSPDDRFLASGSKDGVVMLWDARMQKPTHGRQSLPAHVQSVVSSLPGGQAVVAVSTNRTWSLIDLATFRETPLPLAGGEFFAYAPPNFFGTYDRTNRFRFFGILASGSRLLAELIVGTNFVRGIAYSPETQQLAWSDGSRAIHVVSLNEPEKRMDLSSDLGDRPVQFGSDGRFLLGYGINHTYRVWDVMTGKTVVADKMVGMINYKDKPDLAKIAKAGNALVSLADNLSGYEEVVIRNLLQPEQAPARFKERDLADLALAPDGKTCAVSSITGKVVLYDAAKQEKLAVLHGHLKSARGVVFTSDSSRLASTSGGKDAVKLWDVKTRRELLTLTGQGSLLNVVEFTDDGNTLLVGSLPQGGLWQFWRAPSWAEIEQAERTGGGWPRTEDR